MSTTAHLLLQGLHRLSRQIEARAVKTGIELRPVEEGERKNDGGVPHECNLNRLHPRSYEWTLPKPQ